MDRALPQPGFGVASLLALMVLGLQTALAVPCVVLDIVVEKLMHLPPPHVAQQPVGLACINLVALGATIALGLHLNHLPFRRAFPITRVTGLQIFGILITVLGCGVVLSGVDNVFRALLPPPQFLVDLLKDLFLSEGHLVGRVLLLVVVAPVTEELLFRGIIMRGLLSRHPPGTAILLSALLFSVEVRYPCPSVVAPFLCAVSALLHRPHFVDIPRPLSRVCYETQRRNIRYDPARRQPG